MLLVGFDHFVHVGSHQSRQGIDDFLTWAFDNNDRADVLAGSFQWCTTTLLNAQVHASTAFKRRKSLKQVAHKHYVRVAEYSVSHKAEQPNRASVVPSVDPQLVSVDVSQVFRTAPFEAPPRLRFDGWIQVVNWMEAVYDQAAEVQWVALAELLWSFQLHSGCRGVLSTGNHCTWKLDDLRHEYDAQQAIRSFGKYVVHLFQLQFPELKTISRRPHNHRFQCWTMCLPIRFAAAPRRRLHNWLESNLGDQMLVTISRDVARLPPALDEVSSTTISGVGIRRFFRSG